MAEGMSAPLRITLRPDWGVGPIWVSVAGGATEPYDADEITDVVSLSPELRQAIAAWDDRFHATLNQDIPPESGFSTPEDEAGFIEDGRQLARRIHDELTPEAIVKYMTITGSTIDLDIDQS
jgi:hypothetical protein